MEPVEWHAGRYILEGSVEYRRDTEVAERTLHTDYQAELRILADGAMTLSDSTGTCRAAEHGGDEQDPTFQNRVFWCGEVSFVLRPTPEAVAGELRVWVTEVVRRQGLCSKTGIVNGIQICIAWAQTLGQETVDKAAPLEVVEIFPGDDLHPSHP